ncbi:hypothetical protein EDC44_12530 [Cricetibacter osteomyelitidis]|uniref:UPF0250 protein EDC44_12530 n=1 Tax=Cricetibacter osteomyelitidis TaxID=1521931 RepID=A0A4R2T534_9PAST|nr:DUF493 family protein YbeD [Cricetibacter osteomyelitidis]TCP92188.1 hypothetical protein EDC44_12530 [Cricetibacter osteomyelitidis]
MSVEDNGSKAINLADIPQKKLEDLLEFPCEFTFKVVGKASPELVDNVVATVQKHIKGDYSPTVKPSGKGTYHSVSIAVTAEHIHHIHTLYKELAEIDGVRMVL